MFPTLEFHVTMSHKILKNILKTSNDCFGQTHVGNVEASMIFTIHTIAR